MVGDAQTPSKNTNDAQTPLKGEKSEITPKKGPGRPRKEVSISSTSVPAAEATPKTPSKDVAAPAKEDAVEEPVVKRKAGRPKGVTNSKKYENIIPRRSTRDRKRKRRSSIISEIKDGTQLTIGSETVEEETATVGEPVAEEASTAELEQPRKRPGRPPGAKNKEAI